MMWASASRVVKRWCPAVHTHLKDLSTSRLAHNVGICVPRRIGGRIVWAAPRLISAEPPEEHIVRWISQLLSTGGTFFDVGAHYGWISMVAAHRVGKSGRVVAFEPSPILADFLTYHKRVNQLRQIELVSKAVSDVNAESVPFILLNDGLSFRNSLTIGADDIPFVTSAEKTRDQVAAITLDRFVESTGSIPDVIKIDVEGAELLVLRGAEQVLRHYRPHLIIGVHPYWLPQYDTGGQIFDLLNRHKYEVNGEHVVPFEGGYVADYLCAPGRTNQ